MMRYESIKEWNQYYSRPDVLKKIAYNCRYREITVIKRYDQRKDIPVRPLKIFKPEHLKYWIERLDLNKLFFDLYISNASVKLPKLPTELSKLKESRALLSQQWENMMTGYDIFCDFDASSPRDEPLTVAWAKKVRYALYKREIGIKQPVEIYKTGSGGTHLILKGKFQPSYCKELIMDICCEQDIPMMIPVKNKHGKRYKPENGEWIEMNEEEEIEENSPPVLDNSIYDLRRIRRCPFSLHSKHGKPMIPLDLKETL